MEIFYTIKDLKTYLSARLGQQIGLVPTMGALHDGHLSLIKRAQVETDLVVCSIFVNPIQFNNATDFDKYPRVLETDAKMLQEAGCAVLFAPSAEEMYPQPSKVKITFAGLDNVMEGAFREGHFSGVGVVLAKLFHIVCPTVAYFGQKDYQQCAIVRQLVVDLSFGVRIEVCATMRESDGLAMSSRNRRLNESQRQIAPKLYAALQIAENVLQKTKNIAQAQHSALDSLKSSAEIRVDYLMFADANSLETLETLANRRSVVICIAAFLGDVRLIDNLVVAF